MVVNESKFKNVKEKLGYIGESTQHDKVYDAISAVENGTGTYDDIYKALGETGVESTAYDEVVDELKGLQKEELLQYHNPDETDKLINGSTKLPSVTSKPTESAKVMTATQLLQELRNRQYADPYGKQLENMINAWNNREEFSYDLESDPLYQMAREDAMRMGDIAMRDTIGKASMMSGGYGNSYAQSAGQQAYNAYLQELNANAVNYHNAAYNKYLDDAYLELQKISNVQSLRDQDRAEWEAQYLRDYNNAVSELESEAAANELEFDASKWAAEQEIDNYRWQVELLKDLGYDIFLDENGNLQYSGTTVTDDKTGKSAVFPNADKDADYEDVPVEEEHMKEALDAYMSGGLSGLYYYISQLRESTAGDFKEQYLDNVKNAVHTTNLFGKVANNTSSRWSVIEDGGRNWGSGINNNTVVRYTNEDGTTEDFSLGDLKDKLIEQGASKEMAESLIVNLQKQLNKRNLLPDESD